jgi:glycosyltransferase involved in cell wall biosynthesis
MDELALEYRRRRIEVVRDFTEVIERADLYITENSSTLFEAAAAGIPVVAFEPSFFRLNVHHGGRFWDAADVGVRVRSRGSLDTSLPKKMLAAIAEALEDAPERQAAREKALDIMYAYRSGAAARAAEVLVDWSTDRAARAA